MRNLLSISLCFLFLFSFFSVTARAYIPLTINTSTTVNQPSTVAGFRCVNQTNIDNKTYCYYAESASASYDVYIYRFNSTFGNKSSCTFTGCGVNTKGMAIYNETVLWLTCGYLVDVKESNFAAGTCTNASTYSTAYRQDYISQNWGSWLRNAGLWYFGYSGIKNSTGGSAGTKYWDAENEPYPTMFYLPNASDNSTTYASTGQNASYSKHGLYSKYSGTTFSGWIGSPATLYNIDYKQAFADDLVKEGTTTWHYMVAENLGTLYMYKANWTLAEQSGLGTVIAAAEDSITNTTVNGTSEQMSVSLYTQCNGTIMWYLDGLNIGNTTVNSAPMSSATTYYYSTGILPDGAHSWSASFIDTCGGNTWSVPTVYFTKGSTGAIGVIYTSLGNALGVNNADAKAIFAIMLSTSFAAGLAYYVGTKIFVPSMMGFVLLFAFVGWFPAWMTVVFITIAAMIFAKMSGLT